jgi:hypothetical protein
MLGSAAAAAALTFGAFAGVVETNHSNGLEKGAAEAVMIGAGVSTFYLYSRGRVNAMFEYEIAKELDRREDSQEGGE